MDIMFPESEICPTVLPIPSLMNESSKIFDMSILYEYDRCDFHALSVTEGQRSSPAGFCYNQGYALWVPIIASSSGPCGLWLALGIHIIPGGFP